MTGLATPLRVAATAAPVAPVPAMVSPPPRSKMRARISVGVLTPKRHVGPVREELVALDARAEAPQVEPVQLVAGLDRHLRVAHLHELELELAAVRGQRAPAVLCSRRVVALGAEPRPPDVHRAEVALDPRPHVAGSGANRELVVLGPAPRP